MDKRAIIAFILVGLILFFYDDYLRLVSPRPPADERQTVTDTMHIPAKPTLPRLVEPSISSADTTSIAILTNVATPQSEDFRERLVIVDTERMKITISNRGAQIKSLIIKPIGRYINDSIELIPKPKGSRPGFRFWTNDGPVDTDQLQFQLERDNAEEDEHIRLRAGQNETIVLYAPFDATRGLRLIYTFPGDEYTFTCGVEAVGMDGVWVRDYAEAIWSGGLAYTEEDTSQDHYYSLAYAYFAGDVLEEQKIESKNKQSGTASGQTRWVALRTKYFLAALIPYQSDGLGAWLETKVDSNYIGKHAPNRLGVGIRLPLAGSSPATPIRIFAGPLDNDLLREIDPSLTRTMNWGWAIIAPISKGILWALKKTNALFHNYGVSIITFSIVIKLITWPLTQASSRSMAGMARVQPKMQTLREKYKSDPQRLNKEVMKLYKEEKVNPMSGCLPVLLQMPLLYALFIVFRSTIEFRQAPFIWWIKDLSMPDILFHLPFSIPFYGSGVAILPIAMGISTFYQSKMTMTDPNQKMLLYVMPVMMIFLFNSFPSGLTLYYTLFNVLSLLQYKIVPPPKPVAAPAA